MFYQSIGNILILLVKYFAQPDSRTGKAIFLIIYHITNTNNSFQKIIVRKNVTLFWDASIKFI